MKKLNIEESSFMKQQGEKGGTVKSPVNFISGSKVHFSLSFPEIGNN